MSEELFIVGCGYMGSRIAALAAGCGMRVSALVRKPENARALEENGVAAVIADLDDPGTLSSLPLKGKVVVYLAPPPGGGHLDTRAHAFCESIREGEEPSRIVYMSTTGVYGDTGGETVTEDSPAVPDTPRGKRRVDAEKTFLSWGKGRGVTVVVLRVTGIYGPGKLPISQLSSGHPVLRPEEAGLSNRIHADDLARVCLAAAEKGEDGEIFNVSDGAPSSLTDYFDAVADALGYPRPPRVSLEEARTAMSPLMYSYVTESRVVDNTRMLERLGIRLLYPDFASGLKGITKS